MHAQTAVIDLAQTVGGNLPVFGHTAKRLTLAQFANIGLAAVSIAVHVSIDIHEEVTALKFELDAAVGRGLRPQLRIGVFKRVDNGAREIIDYRCRVKAVDIEHLATVARILVRTFNHLDDRSQRKARLGLRIEVDDIHVGVALKAAFPFTALVGMHTVDGRETRVGRCTCHGHNVALSLLKRDVADDVKVVGSLQGVALVHFDHQGEFARLGIHQINRHILLHVARHRSHPDVVETVLADAGYTQETAVGRAVERQRQVFELAAVDRREAVDDRLHDGVIADDHKAFLAAGNIDDALVHRRRAGALVTDGIAGIVRAAVDAVKNPLVGNFDAVYFGISLPVGHCQGTQCSKQGKE